MKAFRLIIFACLIIMTLSSCRIWNNLFARKSGCPTNGKNVGAERILSGEPEATKAAKKAKRFKS